MTTTNSIPLHPRPHTSAPEVGRNKLVGPLIVLLKYFGPRTEDQTQKQFSQELKTLSPVEKLELATLAADELGIPKADRNFAKLEAEVTEK